MRHSFVKTNTYATDLEALDNVVDFAWEGFTYQLIWDLGGQPCVFAFPKGDDGFYVTWEPEENRYHVRSYYFGKLLKFKRHTSVLGFLDMYRRGVVYLQMKDGNQNNIRLKHYLTD